MKENHLKEINTFDSGFIADLLRQYEITLKKNAEIIPIRDGFGNILVRIRSREYDLVLKKVDAKRPPERVNFSLVLQSLFAAAEIPCAKVHKTVTGSLLAHISGQIFYLQNWCAGEKYWWPELPADKRLHLRKQAGSLLGKMHLLSMGFAQNETPLLCLLNRRELLQQPYRSFGSLAYKRLGRAGEMIWCLFQMPRTLGRRIFNLLPELGHCAHRLAADKESADLDFLEAIAVHGDWNHENVLVDNGLIVSLIDFDNAMIMPRAFDIGSAVAAFCFLGEDAEDFLCEYESASGLQLPAPEVIEVCVLLRIVKSLLWQLVQYRSINNKTLKRKAEWWMLRLIEAFENKAKQYELNNGSVRLGVR